MHNNLRFLISNRMKLALLVSNFLCLLLIPILYYVVLRFFKIENEEKLFETIFLFKKVSKFFQLLFFFICHKKSSNDSELIRDFAFIGAIVFNNGK